MNIVHRLAFLAVAGLGIWAGIAVAQPVKPDPRRLPFALPKDIKWGVDKNFGEGMAILYGDPAKPGIYAALIKWEPGHFSTPHIHSTDRLIYVIKGTWWVSSSPHWDPKTTYPLPPGSFATDRAGQVHWDGAKDEEVLLELVGMGPATTVKINENHK